MNKLFVATFLFVITACTATRRSTTPEAPGQLVIDGKIWSSLFQQRAAEYKALCHQAYNIAKLRLDEAIAQKQQRPLAIVTDMDETFVDNSPYAVHQALQGKDYVQQDWYDWTAKGIADTLAGALAFYQYAASHNVEVFYITNRDENERQGTLNNLQRFHFPYADNQHLVLKQTESSKEERRKKVAATHDIVLFLGDNLADFSVLFDKKTEAERARNVQASAADFGKRFIILPNTNYGGWEDAIYLNQHNWTAAQKDSLLRAGLKKY